MPAGIAVQLHPPSPPIIFIILPSAPQYWLEHRACHSALYSLLFVASTCWQSSMEGLTLWARRKGEKCSPLSWLQGQSERGGWGWAERYIEKISENDDIYQIQKATITKLLWCTSCNLGSDPPSPPLHPLNPPSTTLEGSHPWNPWA